MYERKSVSFGCGEVMRASLYVHNVHMVSCNAYACILLALGSRLSEMAVPVSFIYGDRDW